MPHSRAHERRSTTLYTPPTVKRLLDAVADGLNLSQACVAAGIGRRTMYDWQKRYPRLLKRLEEAREKARQKALATIKRFGENDYKAAAEFLRLSFAADYMRGNTVTVNANAQAGVAVEVSDPERARLIEQRERALSGAVTMAIEPPKPAPVTAREVRDG